MPQTSNRPEGTLGPAPNRNQITAIVARPYDTGSIRQRRAPARMRSVWPEMPFMRGPDGAARLREWLPQQQEIRRKHAARRDRVLAHDWAASRLRLILGLSDARHWNGYVAPATDGRQNDSPIRAALLELLRDVEQAEQGMAPPEAY